jgi:uncharacterized membrane protein
MTTLTQSIVQNIIGELISDMQLSEAIMFTTDVLKELIFVSLNNPEFDKDEKNEMLNAISMELQEAQIDLGLNRGMEEKSEHHKVMFG